MSELSRTPRAGQSSDALAALDAAGIGRDPDALRGAVERLDEEVERLRDALNAAADSCERDRREADKILCHALTMRREAQCP
jgi:outer membrane murein-binding lipoprotein Lpp